MEWQPIETAPHDGTTVELLGKNGKIDFGSWYKFSEYFNKVEVGLPVDIDGEFSTEYGEGPFSHWREAKN